MGSTPSSRSVWRDPLVWLCTAPLTFIAGWAVVGIVGWENIRKVDGPTWAAWVQAFGSIAAIVGAFAVATYQGRQQRRSAEIQRAMAQLDMAERVGALADGAINGIEFVAALLDQREKIHAAAEFGFDGMLAEVRAVGAQFGSVPLSEVPPDVVRITMLFGAIVRQVDVKVSVALASHRSMDGAAFQDFFQTINAAREAAARARGELRDVCMALRHATLEE